MFEGMEAQKKKKKFLEDGLEQIHFFQNVEIWKYEKGIFEDQNIEIWKNEGRIGDGKKKKSLAFCLTLWLCVRKLEFLKKKKKKKN